MPMTRRTRSWFDEEKLFPQERIVRSSRAWMRTSQPCRNWEGELVLTTDRLFFLPEIEHPLIGGAAHWLSSIASATAIGRHEFRIGDGAAQTIFHVLGERAAMSDLIVNRANAWISEIAALRPQARSPETFAEPTRRRAAG